VQDCGRRGDGIVSSQLRGIAEVVGARSALRLAEHYGGLEGCYVPRTPRAEHPWARLIGLEAFRRLCWHYGGERIDIPRNAAARSVKSRILRLKGDGLSHRRIAADLGCTERYVRMIVNAGAGVDERQGDLFA